MAAAPSPELQAQGDRYIQKRFGELTDAIARRDVEIKNDHAKRGLLRSGIHLGARLSARDGLIREHCAVVVTDLIALLRRNHALTKEGGVWLQHRVTRHVDELVQSLQKMTGHMATEPLSADVKNRIEMMGASIKAKAQLEIDTAVADMALVAAAEAGAAHGGPSLQSPPQEAVTQDVSTQTQEPKAPAPPGAPSSPVDGRFELQQEIGRGAQGVVYMALDTRLNRRVALKILTATSAEARQRFIREGTTLANVHHHGVAVVYDAGEAGGRPFIAMEYVEGHSLAHRLKAGALALSEAVRIADAAADALGAIHAAGVLHRDLKPGNVMISVAGDVKILDFGLAKAMAADSSPPTATGMVLGTPYYMSPEQLGAREVDPRADLWAWGCIFFEMVTGQRPFGGTTMAEVAAGVTLRDPKWEALPPDVPAGIVSLLRDCLAKDRDQRPRDITAARQQLLAAMTNPTETPSTASTPAEIDTSIASKRFRALLQHVQNTDVADTAAVTVLERYAQHLGEGITRLITEGVLAPDSKVEIRSSPGAAFALPAGYRAPLLPGSAMTVRIATSDPRMYAGLEAHVQVEIPEPPGSNLQVRWMPIAETNIRAEVVARFPLADLLPKPAAATLQAIRTDGILNPAMDLLLKRAEATVTAKGYKLPGGVTATGTTAPAHLPFSQLLDPPARDLLVAIIREMQPREDYHEFWAVGSFGGWQLLLMPRGDSEAAQKTLEERSGKFELTDLENLQAHGYIRLQARGRSEYRGTVTPKAFAEYDGASR